MFRDSNGTIVALENACPHRKLPLTRGRRKGDTIECGYHGLTFNGTGQCVHAPGKGGIPSNAKVHAYPCEERYGLGLGLDGQPGSGQCRRDLRDRELRQS